MAILRMTDLDLRNKRVLIREDLNVPIDNGRITSEQRISAALPTIRLALEKGAAVMVTSHLGRPKEGVWSEADSLAPVAERLSVLLGREVPLVRDWVDGLLQEQDKGKTEELAYTPAKTAAEVVNTYPAAELAPVSD